MRCGDDREGQHAQQVERHAEQDGAKLAQKGVGQPAAERRHQVGDAHEEQQGLAGLGTLPAVGRPVEEEHQVGGDAVEGHSLQQLGQQHGGASQPPPVKSAARCPPAFPTAQQGAALARLGLLHDGASFPAPPRCPAHPEETWPRSRGGARPAQAGNGAPPLAEGAVAPPAAPSRGRPGRRERRLRRDGAGHGGPEAAGRVRSEVPAVRVARAGRSGRAGRGARPQRRGRAKPSPGVGAPPGLRSFRGEERRQLSPRRFSLAAFIRMPGGVKRRGEGRRGGGRSGENRYYGYFLR